MWRLLMKEIDEVIEKVVDFPYHEVYICIPMTTHLTPFGDYDIRHQYDEEKNTWYFSVIDIIQALLEQSDFQTARKYWNKLKERLIDEGSQVVTNCHQLRLKAEDGRMRFTDVANTETVLRLIQSVPSPKAEPMK